MRVMCGDFAMEIEWVRLNGKQLVFKGLDGTRYHTDDYFSDNIAYCKLNDLVVNGYIRVDSMHT